MYLNNKGFKSQVGEEVVFYQNFVLKELDEQRVLVDPHIVDIAELKEEIDRKLEANVWQQPTTDA